MAISTTPSDVRVRAGAALIEGDLVVPARAAGLVVFAHGSGSSRFSRRNRFVAQTLEDAGYATLLMDLLTNRAAMRRMHAPAQLEIVPGATHLCEEPGTLERVAQLAVE